MIPRIFDVKDGVLVVTAECYTVPELKKFIDKYPDNHKPYLWYIYCHVHPESPYANVPKEEKEEAIVPDTIDTLGDFDSEDPMLRQAVTKLTTLYTSTTMRHFLSGKIMMDTLSSFYETAMVKDGKDGNLAEVQRGLREMGATMKSFREAEKQADEELKDRMKGNSELGEY